MLQERVDAAALVAAKAGTYGGGVSAVFFGLSANEFAAVTGAVVAVLGLVVQVAFNRRRDRREAAEHEMRMRSYGGTD